MLYLRRVTGTSMLPGLPPGTLLLAISRPPRVGWMVLAELAGQQVVKRLVRIDTARDRYYLQGDADASADSRHYGPVPKRAILGVVMITLPVAVDPPVARHPRALVAGWMLAAGTIVLLVAQLYRIDELLPATERWGLPGGIHTGVAIILLLMTAELFAVPALLRMRLSPLGHIVSAGLSIVAPWGWLLTSLWLYGSSASSLLLGTLVAVPWYITLVVALMWLAASLQTLKMLGYDHRSLLRKRPK